MTDPGMKVTSLAGTRGGAAEAPLQPSFLQQHELAIAIGVIVVMAIVIAYLIGRSKRASE